MRRVAIDFWQRLGAQVRMPSGALGWLAAVAMPAAHEPIYAAVARELRLGPDDDLLEVGCGSGAFVCKYAAHVRSVAGLDLSEIQLRLATRRNRTRIAAGRATFVRGDAAELPWEDGTFTVVTCMGSLVWLEEPLRALQEMHRVLAPGGRAVVSIEVNAEAGAIPESQSRRLGMHLWTEADVRRMMAEAGFADVSITYRSTKGFPRLMLAGGRKE